jgi:hypothetical protein
MTSSNLGLTLVLTVIYLFFNAVGPPKRKTRRRLRRARTTTNGARAGDLLLPRALLVAIRLQALPALVLVHLQTSFLFQITHVGAF